MGGKVLGPRWRGWVVPVTAGLATVAWISMIPVARAAGGPSVIIEAVCFAIAIGIAWLLPRTRQPIMEVGWGLLCLGLLARLLVLVAPPADGLSIQSWFVSGPLALGIVVIGIGLLALHRETRRRHRMDEMELESLRDRSRRLALIDREIPVVTWTTDTDLVFTSSIGSGLVTVGLEPNEIVGSPIQEVMKDQPGEAVFIDAHQRALAGETTPAGVMFGGERFRCRVEPLRDANGIIVGVAGVATNATDEGRTQSQLLESNQRLALLTRQSPLGAIVWNAEFRVVEWNTAAERIFGFAAEEALGRHASELMVPSDLRDLVDQVFKALIEQRGGERSTNENITRDRRRILCEWYNAPLVDLDGEVIGVSSLVHDVTDRTIAEKALRRSEARYRTMIDQCPFGIVMYRPDGTPVNANASFAELWDLDESDLGVFFDAYNIFTDPAFDDGGFLPSIRRSFEGQTINLPRFQYAPPAGRTASILPWIRIHLYPVRDPEGGIREVVTLYEDVTDRVRSEQEVRESEAKFRSLAENVPGAIYLCSSDDRRTMVFVNDGVENLTGYSKEDFLNDAITLDELIHEDDRLDAQRTIEAALLNHQRFDVIYRMRDREGRWHTVEEHGVGIYSDNQLVYREGILTDVSAERQPAANGVHATPTDHSQTRSPGLSSTADLDEFSRASHERATAFASIHEGIHASGAGQIPMDALLWLVLGDEADGDAAGARVTLSGEPLPVPASVGVPLAMALHELLTNACRFGALARDDEGAVAIQWATVAGRAIDLTWSEHGGPAVPRATMPGIGLRLVDAIITRQLAGRVDVDFQPDGVVARIVVPYTAAAVRQ